MFFLCFKDWLKVRKSETMQNAITSEQNMDDISSYNIIIGNVIILSEQFDFINNTIYSTLFINLNLIEKIFGA